MPKILAFIHTLAALVGDFDRMAAERLPALARMHVVDEPLLARIMKRGAPNADDAERVGSHVATAGDAGAVTSPETALRAVAEGLGLRVNRPAH